MGWSWQLDAGPNRLAHLRIQELDDVALSPQALQQGDLVNEAAGCLSISPLQPNALQSKNLAIWSHHLQPAPEI